MRQDYHEETQTYLSEHIEYSTYRSAPEDGYYVYQIRASDDYETKEALIQKDESELLHHTPQEGRPFFPSFSFSSSFSSNPRTMTRDTKIEVQRNPEGEIERACYWQYDARTGEFVSSGVISDTRWLLESARVW